MSQKKLSWVEAFNEAMKKDIQVKNTDVEVAFFVREPTRQEIDEMIQELEALEAQIQRQ
jgi:hypothetical protein